MTRTYVVFAIIGKTLVGLPLFVAAQDPPKLWIDNASADSFTCGALTYRLVDYDRDDSWFGHVFELEVTNHSDSSAEFDPTAFQAILRNGMQETYPSAEELAERAVNGYKGKKDLNSPEKQERRRLEIKSRRDLTAEHILPGASSKKRIALGPATTGGIAIGGRSAEALKEYRAADIPLTLYCHGRRVGVVSRPVK